jgi:hypothetical protein
VLKKLIKGILFVVGVELKIMREYIAALIKERPNSK